MMGSSNPSLSSPYQSSPHNGRLKTRNTFIELVWSNGTTQTQRDIKMHSQVYSPSQSILQLEYPSVVNVQPQQTELPQLDLGLTVLVFKQGDDPIDAINHMMSFLSAVVTSCYPTTKNQLRNSSNPRQQAIINDGRVTLQPVQGRQISFVTDKVLLVQAQANGQILHEEELAFLADLGIAKDVLTEVYNPDNIDNNMINQSVHAISSSKQSSVVIHSETDITSDSNIILYSQYVHETQQKSMNSSNPIPSCTPTRFEVPKELPKVTMVNTSLKKVKHHLAGFDVVVKERTMITAMGSCGFEHTKACFKDEISLFVKALKDIFNTFDQYLIDELTEVQNVFHQMKQGVKQHCLESKIFEGKVNQVLNDNDRILVQVINKDIVNTVVNSSVDNAFVNVHECEKCLKLETELLNKKDSLKKRLTINFSNAIKILKNIEFL
nr:hypothetical protein [Tanacetum cinerariifolium]